MPGYVACRASCYACVDNTGDTGRIQCTPVGVQWLAGMAHVQRVTIFTEESHADLASIASIESTLERPVHCAFIPREY